MSANNTMTFTRALVRRPGTQMAEGITTSPLGPPDHAKALIQFDAYVAALKDCGITVTVLDALDGCPDAHFVEDTAVITPHVAVITRPGAASRRSEVTSIAEALAPQMPTAWIEPPGTVDGGDVLMMGNHLLIGLSDRTNRSGADQLGKIVAKHDHTWTTVPVAAGLHFKSSVNGVGPDTVLTTNDFAQLPALSGYRRIIVSEKEAYAANTLLVNKKLLMPAGFNATRHLLQPLESPVVELDVSEFRKMDGGLTCLSLRW